MAMAAPKQPKQVASKQKDIFQEDKRLVSEIGLNKHQIDDLKEKFKKYDPTKSGNGNIGKYEIFDTLREAGYIVNDKVKSKISEELQKAGQKKAEFIFVAQIAKYSQDIEEEDEEMESINSEYLDAFLAMGGGPLTEGFVKKQTIIDIIKNEFELNFDMEEFLEEISANQENLDFKLFCQLFEGQGVEDTRSITSRQSILSAFSRKGRRKQSFHVRYKDFLKYCEKMDGL